MFKEIKAEAMYYSKVLCYGVDLLSFALVLKTFNILSLFLTKYITFTTNAYAIEAIIVLVAGVLALYVLPYVGYYAIVNGYRGNRTQ